MSKIIRKRKVAKVGEAPSVPMNHAAFTVLSESYSDTPVIITAVVELLRDYNPFRCHPGLSKQMVMKYLKILLKEAPDLSDYIISCLPDASDLISAEVMAKMPAVSDGLRRNSSQTFASISVQTCERMPSASCSDIGESLSPGELSHSDDDGLMTPSQLNSQLSTAWDPDKSLDAATVDQTLTRLQTTDSGPQVAPPSPLLPPSSLYLPVLADLHQNYQSTNHAQQNTCGEDNSNLDGWFKSPMSYGEMADIGRKTAGSMLPNNLHLMPFNKAYLPTHMQTVDPFGSFPFPSLSPSALVTDPYQIAMPIPPIFPSRSSSFVSYSSSSSASPLPGVKHKSPLEHPEPLDCSRPSAFSSVAAGSRPQYGRMPQLQYKDGSCPPPALTEKPKVSHGKATPLPRLLPKYPELTRCDDIGSPSPAGTAERSPLSR